MGVENGFHKCISSSEEYPQLNLWVAVDPTKYTENVNSNTKTAKPLPLTTEVQIHLKGLHHKRKRMMGVPSQIEGGDFDFSHVKELRVKYYTTDAQESDENPKGHHIKVE